MSVQSRLADWFAPPQPLAVAEKAAVGPGVGMIQMYPQMSLLSETPQKRMWAAQRAYHENAFIRIAESVVTRKVVGLPWHYEDADDNEYDEKTAPEPVQVAMHLLDKPQAALTGRRQMTWGQLISITSRHVGLCGVAYWYLDQIDSLAGIPLSLLYLNPARIWPAQDASGNLTGWILDPKDSQGNGGTPLEMNEVLPFYLDEPDMGFLGSGLYEAVRMKALISSSADQHALYTIQTGGRLPGVYSPHEGSIPDDKFQTLVREFKNVASDPQASKLSIVTQGPMDFSAASMNVSEMDLIDISKMTREDILAVWGVPSSQAGYSPQHAGLNSGGTKETDIEILMTGSVHDRVRAIKEPVQAMLDRWLTLGVTIELEIEEPEYDDQAVAFKMASEAVGLPMSNKERRELVGLPPLDDPAIDEAIVLPPGYSTYATVGQGLEPPKPPPVPFGQVPPLGGVPPTPSMVPGKANARRTFLGLRHKVDTEWVKRIETDLRATLEDQRKAIAYRVRTNGGHLASKPTDQGVWWTTQEERRLAKALTPHMTALASEVATEARKVLPAKADPFTDKVVAIIATKVGKRIADIDQTTRDAVAQAIAEGFANGLSAAEVGDVIEGLTTFDEYRAELIARTETMFTYNAAALDSYSEYGVTQVQAIDGDGDEVCAERDGQIYTLDEAGVIEDHPNGTLDWAPYFEAGKASPREVAPPPTFDLAAIMNVLAAKAEPTPVYVNIVNGEVKNYRTVLDRDPLTGRVTGTHEEEVVADVA